LPGLHCDTGSVRCGESWLYNVDGAIGPATASYISRSIEEAKGKMCSASYSAQQPGGLLDSTQRLCKASSIPVPVVVYVAPTGATATTQVVSSRWRPRRARRGHYDRRGASGFPSAVFEWWRRKADETMKQKLENFSVSYHGDHCRASASATLNGQVRLKEALDHCAKSPELKVIDLIADRYARSAAKMNGRVVDGKPLNTVARNWRIKMSPAERVFQNCGDRKSCSS